MRDLSALKPNIKRARGAKDEGQIGIFKLKLKVFKRFWAKQKVWHIFGPGGLRLVPSTKSTDFHYPRPSN